MYCFYKADELLLLVLINGICVDLFFKIQEKTDNMTEHSKNSKVRS